MKVLGVILARGGSKTIPLKNIALVNGKPLITYSIREGWGSGELDRLVVSTDHDEIAKVAHNAGAYVIKRPTENYSEDCTPSWLSLKWTVEKAEKEYKDTWEIIAEIPATNPLKTREDIRNAIRLMKDENNYCQFDSVVSVSPLVEHHPTRAKKIDKIFWRLERYCDKCGHDDNRKQDLTPAYFRNGAVYVMKRETLFDFRGRFGEDVLPYEMPEERGINIDTPLDLKFAEFLLKERSKDCEHKFEYSGSGYCEKCGGFI